MKHLAVRDLMTATPFSLTGDATLFELGELMDDKGIRHVPVVDDDGEVIGLVSQRDFVRMALAPAESLPVSLQVDALHVGTVADVMVNDVETVDPDTNIASAARVMLENKFGCLPVVEGSRLVGILTEADFVRRFAG
ncbi:MAG: CBS domain-containing protein [Acidobacteriota bacterium]|nr:CBS domain-containing protein [Acidobacteriota bacterium]MDH3785162.1 CBS domain-containing protein [Acidobacteriota bacterium]